MMTYRSNNVVHRFETRVSGGCTPIYISFSAFAVGKFIKIQQNRHLTKKKKTAELFTGLYYKPLMYVATRCTYQKKRGRNKQCVALEIDTCCCSHGLHLSHSLEFYFFFKSFSFSSVI